LPSIRPLRASAYCVALACLCLATSTAFAQSLSAQPMTLDPDRDVLSLSSLVKQVGPSVLSIRTVDGDAPSAGDGSITHGIGSGVVIDTQKGHVLTNHHVIKGATEILVMTSDQREFSAVLLGSDPSTDLALLQVPGADLPALNLAADDTVEVGDFVLAIGNPYGLSASVTTGIVSALGREGDDPLGYTDFIQTDASINPGNSGGALVNSRGELVGINAAIVAASGSGTGIGFAVPAHTLRPVAGQLAETGTVERGTMGVMVSPVSATTARRLDLDSHAGAHIVEVSQGSAAALGGLRTDDIVTHANGLRLGGSSDLRYAVGRVAPGEALELQWIRAGDVYKGTVRIAPSTRLATASSQS